MHYELNITFDQKGLQRVYDLGQAVALARSADSTPPSSTTIAWLMNMPFNSNQITWEEAYAFYVTTTTPLKPGININLNGVTPGKLGARYTLDNGSFSVDPAGTNPQGFEVVNHQDGPARFGLALKAWVNGTERIAATSVFELVSGEARNVTPGNTLAIFLATYLDDGTVLRMIPTNALTLDLSTQGPVISVAYNEATNSFELVQPACDPSP